jgi:hypothetical protein
MTMHWMLAGALLLTLAASSPAAAQTTNCPPPPEWAGVSKIGEWRVSRLCSTGADVVSIRSQRASRLLVLRCDAARGPYGDVVFLDHQISAPAMLTLQGSPEVIMGVRVSDVGSQVAFDDVALTKRFMTALVDGQGPNVTVVVVPRDQPALELVFPRNGLAAAAKPLRARCGW